MRSCNYLKVQWKINFFYYSRSICINVSITPITADSTALPITRCRRQATEQRTLVWISPNRHRNDYHKVWTVSDVFIIYHSHLNEHEKSMQLMHSQAKLITCPFLWNIYVLLDAFLKQKETERETLNWEWKRTRLTKDCANDKFCACV